MNVNILIRVYSARKSLHSCQDLLKELKLSGLLVVNNIVQTQFDKLNLYNVLYSMMNYSVNEHRWF